MTASFQRVHLSIHSGGCNPIEVLLAAFCPGHSKKICCRVSSCAWQTKQLGDSASPKRNKYDCVTTCPILALDANVEIERGALL